MSTYWGFVCRSHDPEIESEHWFNRGAALLADAYQKQRAGEWPNIEGLPWPEPQGVEPPGGGFPKTDPIHWLRAHPACDVALRSEYGDTRELNEEAH